MSHSFCVSLFKFSSKKNGYPSSFCAIPYFRSLASLWFYYTWIQLSTSTCPVSCTQTEVGSHGKSRATFGCKDKECRDCGYNSWVNWHVEYHPIMSAPAGTTRGAQICDTVIFPWSFGPWRAGPVTQIDSLYNQRFPDYCLGGANLFLSFLSFPQFRLPLSLLNLKLLQQGRKRQHYPYVGLRATEKPYCPLGGSLL